MPNKTENNTKSKSRKRGKYDWVDTAGFTHRYFFDSQSIDQPRTTWIILLTVTLVAFGIGCSLIWLLPSKKPSSYHYSKYSTSADSQFQSAQTFDLASPNRPSQIAAGPTTNDETPLNTFFVAGNDQIVQYNIKGETVAAWKINEATDANSEAEPPTALYFVRQENHPLNGSLLIAFQNQIDVLNPATENATIEPFLTLGDDSYITSFATDELNLFVADYGKKIILKYSGDDCKTRSLEIGHVTEANQEAGFLGLVLSATPYFDIAYHPILKSILTTNSVRFRVESFEALSGDWQKDNSWERFPTNPNGFSGCCNPVQIDVFSDGYILTTEKGKTSPIKIFDAKGNPIALLNPPEQTIPLDGKSALHPVLLNDFQIAVLSPYGQIEIFERPAIQE